jgi:hypothetical protein
MKGNKKYGAVVPILSMAIGLASPAVYVYAADTTTPTNIVQTAQTAQMPTAVDSFATFQGTVTSIYTINDKTMVSLQSDANTQMDFVLSENTILMGNKGFLKQDEFKVGDKIQSYYLPQMTTLLYTTQTQPVVLFKGDNGGKSVAIDFFDNNMLSAKGDLKLNVGSQNIVMDQYGQIYKGSIYDKVLAVVYASQTGSDIVQASPELIIVLDIDKSALQQPVVAVEPAPEESTKETGTVSLPLEQLSMENLPKMQFLLNAKPIETTRAYATKGNIIMVPLIKFKQKVIKHNKKNYKIKK